MRDLAVHTDEVFRGGYMRYCAVIAVIGNIGGCNEAEILVKWVDLI